MANDYPLLAVAKVVPCPYCAARDENVRRVSKFPPNPLNLCGREYPYVVNVSGRDGRPEVNAVVQLVEQNAVAAVRVKRVPKKQIPKLNAVVAAKLVA